MNRMTKYLHTLMEGFLKTDKYADRLLHRIRVTEKLGVLDLEDL